MKAVADSFEGVVPTRRGSGQATCSEDVPLAQRPALDRARHLVARFNEHFGLDAAQREDFYCQRCSELLIEAGLEARDTYELHDDPENTSDSAGIYCGLSIAERDSLQFAVLVLRWDAHERGDDSPPFAQLLVHDST